MSENLELVLLDDLVEINHGFAFKSKYFTNTPNNVILLTPGNFHVDQRLYFGERTKYYTGGYTQDFVLTNGDLVIVMTDLTPAMNILGNAVIISSEKIVLHNQRIGKIQIKDTTRIDKCFLLYVLNSNRVRRMIKATASGTTVHHTSPSRIKAIYIPVPAISEQCKIVEILSTWDEALARTEHLITTLKQRKKGLMQSLLTGQVRFPGFEGEWKEYRFEQIASKSRYSFTGGPFGSNLKAESYTSTGVRIIQLQNIGDGEFVDDYKIYTSEEKADGLLSCNIYPGEIILSKMGDPVARATILPNIEKRFLMASDGIRLKVEKSCFDTLFILETINAFEFRKNAARRSVGSTRQRIGLGDLRSLRLKVPSLIEQQKISAILQTCNDEISILGRQLEGLKKQKRGLIQRLLSGEVHLKVE